MSTATPTAPVIDRSRTVGGSDVAAILGISPFRTPLDCWREKVLGQRDTVDTPATRAGQRFEPHLLASYAAKLPAGAKVWTPEPVFRDWRRATVDALAEVNGWRKVVEAKTSIMARDFGADGSDVVPLHHAVQATWYMDLLELDECDFPVLIWPHDMRDLLGLTPAEIVAECEPITLKVAFSPSLARLMRERVEAFWRDNVQGQTPPAAVDLEDIKRLVWVARGKTIPADEDLVRLLIERDRIKAEAKAIELREQANEFAIRQRLGDAEAAIHPKTKQPLVTCSVTERAAYVANVKATSYRTIRTTKNWKEMQK